MHKDYIKQWKLLTREQQLEHRATQSQLYRRATALINKQETEHEQSQTSPEETPEETKAQDQDVSGTTDCCGQTPCEC